MNSQARSTMVDDIGIPIDTTDRYWESMTPGPGRRGPRADAVGDARRLSLNGIWRFRLSPTAGGTGDAFIADDFDDDAWDPIRSPRTGCSRSSRRWPADRRGRCEEPPKARCTRTLRTRSRSIRPGSRPRTRPATTVSSSTSGRLGTTRCCASRASTRARRSGSTAIELGWSMGSRLPFEFDAPGAGGPQRARRAGAPLVGGHLPRRPGHVVAPRDLPRRRADRTARRRHRRRLRPRRLRPGDGHRHPPRGRDHRRAGRGARAGASDGRR